VCGYGEGGDRVAGCDAVMLEMLLLREEGESDGRGVSDRCEGAGDGGHAEAQCTVVVVVTAVFTVL